MFIDLSHTIENGMVTYKGLPAPLICDYWSREESAQFYKGDTSFQIGKIEMVANTGTYLDVPFHRFSDGKDLTFLDLKDLVNLDAVIIDVSQKEVKAIDAAYFKKIDLKEKAVLVRTGWSKHWRTAQYYENYPYLTADAAAYLVEQKVKLVGIDSHNIDESGKNKRPVHSQLLGNDILIVEHLTNLESIPKDKHFSFTATPPKIKGFGTFPVRAFATVED